MLLCVSAHSVAFPQRSPRRIVSPEISADNRVTIRFRAPTARVVAVTMDGYRKPLHMIKGQNGVWSVTTNPLVPDLYGYSILRDGLRFHDPNNPNLLPNIFSSDNGVHVPGPSSLPWEMNDVPNGEVHHDFYHSKMAGDERDFYVYTPPNYDASSKQRYPVLYLLHGFSDEANAWILIGRVNVIMDNLIAQRKAKPMIVVMPLCYGTHDIIAHGRLALPIPALFADNYRKFREMLIEEIMPLAESMYRVSTDRESHALAGLSMGGSEALFIGLNDLDRFGYIGAFSSDFIEKKYAATFPDVNSTAAARVRVLWMSCGKDDFFLKQNERLRDWLSRQGIRVEWVESPGAHWWPVWRRNLSDLLPQLFQEKPSPSDYWTQRVQPQR